MPRLDGILQSRAIHGLLLLPSWYAPDWSGLEWSRYAGVYTDYISALTEDKGQFLPDGLMPAGGPKTPLATEKLVGNVKSSVSPAKLITPVPLGSYTSEPRGYWGESAAGAARGPLST